MTKTELKRIMKQQGWTVSILADEMGVHRATVYRWLAGDFEVPEKMARLIRLLAEREAVKA